MARTSRSPPPRSCSGRYDAAAPGTSRHRVLFGRDDGFIPLEYLEGIERHGDDIVLELVPGSRPLDAGAERPDLVAERFLELYQQ